MPGSLLVKQFCQSSQSVFAFLSEHPETSPAERCEVLMADLQRRYESGDSIRLEEYLIRCPDVAGDLALKLRLVVGDYQARLDAGQSPTLEDYAREFPDLELPLRDHMSATISSVAEDKEAGAAPTIHRSMNPPVDTVISGIQVAKGGHLALGNVFGDYRIEGELARGGMGVVFKARQVSLNRPVALKMILSGQLASEDDVKRFHAEAEAAANLDHPGIVSIHEVGEHAGQHYFSMVLVEGTSLSSAVMTGPLPPKEAAQITKSIAEAMAYAHERGVIHRDLKPANILLAKREETTANQQSGAVFLSIAGMNAGWYQPKVTDFGLAKKTEGNSQLTGTGQILGTPSYMPPEQAAGQTEEIGPLSDVYSLGAILYCLLTGRPPFQAASVMDTLLEVIEKEPLSPRQLNSSVPADLATICLKCMEKIPNKRYPSAKDLMQDLSRFLNGEPIVARPINAGGRVWRWCKRKPGIASLTGALSLAVLIGLVAVSLLWQRAELARRKAETATRESEANLYHSLLREAEAVRQVRESGYQPKVWARLAEAANIPSVEVDYARLRQEAVACLGDFVGTEPITIRGSGLERAPDRAVFLDDDHLAVALRNGQILIRDVMTGKETARLNRTGSAVYSMDMCHEGKTLILGDLSSLERWDQQPNHTWVPTWRIPARFNNKTGFCLFAQSTRIAFARAATVFIVETMTGNVVTTLNSPSDVRLLSTVAATPNGEYVAAASSAPFKIVVWRVKDQKVFKEIEPPTTGIPTLAFSTDGQFMVLGSDQGFITYRTQDFAQWSLSRMDTINNISFSPDGRYLLFPTITSSVQLWSMATQRMSAALRHPGSMIGYGSTGFSPTGMRFFSAGGNVIRIWTMKGLPEKMTLRGHTQAVPCVAYHPREPVLASGSKDGKIIFWNSRDGSELRTLSVQAPVQSIHFSPDGSLFAAGMWSPRPGVRVWQTETFQEIPIHSLPASRSNVNGVRFSPDGKMLATTGVSGTQLWHINRSTHEELPTFTLENLAGGNANFTTFDSSSRYLVVTAGGFQYWDLTQPKPKTACRLPIRLLSGWHNVACDPNQRVLYGVTAAGTVEGWDLSSKQRTTTISGAEPFQSYH